MSDKANKKTGIAGVGAERLGQIRLIVQAVSKVKLKQWPAWTEISQRADKVEIRAINAEADSITIDNNIFSGLLRLNLLVIFKEDGEEFGSSDYAVGHFSGTLNKSGEPEINQITFNPAAPDQEEPDVGD